MPSPLKQNPKPVVITQPLAHADEALTQQQVVFVRAGAGHVGTSLMCVT